MALPKVNTPTFDIKIPSLDKEVQFRPFLIKEEKLLLIALETAKESKDAISSSKEIANAVSNVISNCIMDKSINIKSLASFDIEYIFLKLRAKSVSEISEINYIWKDCGSEEIKNTIGECVQKFSLNLSELELEFYPDNQKKIMITDEIGVIMKYPTNEIFFEMAKQKNEISSSFDLIIACIDQIFDANNLYATKDYTKAEMVEFLEGLLGSQIENILKFFQTLPKLKKTLNKSCEKCGKEIEINLEGIQDFFG